VRYQDYGRTGKRVSVLGFGAMRLPFEDREESVALLQRGLAFGINFIDSAFGYGEGLSEEIVGEAVKGQREKVFLATKNPLDDDTLEGWQYRLETSLKRLQTDYLDFYKVVHALDWDSYTRVFEPKMLKTALKAKAEGMIRHLTFSCHDTPENIVKLIDTGIFEGMLVQYNLLDRRNEEVIAYAREKGLGVEIMGPVGGGRLGMASAQVQGLLNGVSSTAELALRFVLANPAVTLALSGMNTRAQVEANCAVADRSEPLSSDEKQAITQALEENRRLEELYCTGCGYCLPCPQGVAISEVFAAMNYHRVWGLSEYARQRYAHLASEDSSARQDASLCEECGQCQEKCPQKIAIIEQLKESHRTLS
jgi:uncharacterized protein